MKTLLLLAGMIFVYSQVNAQRTVEEKYSLSPGQKIHLEFDFANEIKLTKWEKNEVFVKVLVNINDGKHNDNFKLKVNDSPSRLSIESEIGNLNNLYRDCTTIVIKDGDTVLIDGNRTKMDLYFEVFLPNDPELIVETINGDIVSTGFSGPFELNTINGDIDLYISPDAKADLSMETINGTMYTDLDMELIQKKGSLCKVGGDVDTKLNGGGPEINLSTINGTMYLRKN